MSTLRTLIAWTAALAIPLCTGSSVADDRAKQVDQDTIRAALERGEVLPLVDILRVAQQAVPGDVISVELERRGEVIVYEIIVLTGAGRIREVEVDARTGAIIEIEDD